MRQPVTLRFVCAYNPDHGVHEETFFSPDKRLLFPDGRRLPWQSVCRECRGMRAEWEEKRDMEKFRLAEAARERRAERLEFRGERQREADLAKMANIEAQMAMLQNSLDKLRKKYSSTDHEKFRDLSDKNT